MFKALSDAPRTWPGLPVKLRRIEPDHQFLSPVISGIQFSDQSNGPSRQGDTNCWDQGPSIPDASAIRGVRGKCCLSTLTEQLRAVRGGSKGPVTDPGVPNTSIALASPALAFQNPHDGDYGVPIPCRRRHTEQFVDLAKIADRFYVATVHSEDESVFRRDNSHEPLPAWRKCAWNGSQAAVGFRQDAHESNHIRA